MLAPAATVVAVALALLGEAANAQDSDLEVTARLSSSSFSLEEGLSTAITVRLDRNPGREVWVDWKLTHHGGADEDDYWFFPSTFYFPADRAVQFVLVTATNDKLDDDCESVEFSLSPRSSGVVGDGRLTIAIVDDDGETVDCTAGIGDDPPQPPPPPEPEPPQSDCTLTAPYWSGPTGGFTVRPAPGRTSVSLTCGGRTTEYVAEDGLVTRLVESSCRGTGLQLTGAAPGGWYWQHGDRNAAVAPLVCSEALGGPRAVVPDGVTAEVAAGATLIRHDTARLIGIVPHLAGNECAEYVTPYWQGDGGVVVRPAEGRETVRVRVQCGRTYSTMTPSAGEDGVIAELVSKSYCTDDEGNPKQGGLTVTGAAPGGWYWINGEANAAVSPLMCADLLGGPEAVDPGGVVTRSTEDGTYFQHDADHLIGVVPHLAPNPEDD